MKTKKKIIKSTSLKLLLVIPIFFLGLVVFSLNASGQKTTKVKTETTPSTSDNSSTTGMTDGAYQIADEMPVFPGGDEGILKYISDNIHYPKEAKDKGIQGKVIAHFKIKTDGTVSDVSVLKGVDLSLDKEAIRVVSTLPRFSPGKLKGKTVPVWYTIPITFSLN